MYLQSDRRPNLPKMSVFRHDGSVSVVILDEVSSVEIQNPLLKNLRVE